MKVQQITENSNNKIEILKDNLRMAEAQVEEFMKISHDKIEKDVEGLHNLIEDEKTEIVKNFRNMDENLDYFFGQTKEKTTKHTNELNTQVEEEKQKFNRQIKIINQ